MVVFNNVIILLSKLLGDYSLLPKSDLPAIIILLSKLLGDYSTWFLQPFAYVIILLSKLLGDYNFCSMKKHYIRILIYAENIII